MNRKRIHFAAAIALAAPLALAQQTLEHPTEQFIDRELDSGPLANPTDNPEVVFAALVETHDAPWTRLYFTRITLDGDSAVRFTSLLDGQIQKLDSHGVAMWQSASAYFNGDAVLVELIAAPHTDNNRVVLRGVGTQAEPPHAQRTTCGTCNNDERVPSSEDWVGRIVPPACSAAVFNTSSCAVSAGHCRRNNMVMQFRVPQSLPTCEIQHPPVSDQFPVTDNISDNSGIGRDWMVMTVGTNDLGQTPYERYGQHRPITDDIPPAPVGETVNAWGYGSSKDCVKSQAQQKSTGLITASAFRSFQHTASTTSGSSGSPLVHNDEILGIATNCSPGCPNIAQHVAEPDFVSARQQLCPEPGCPPDWNGDGVVDSDDLFDFLADWASGDADYNGDGVTDSDDLFDFLADWASPGQFPGC